MKWIVESPTHLRQLPEMEEPEMPPYRPYGMDDEEYHYETIAAEIKIMDYYGLLASMPTIPRGDNGVWSIGDVKIEGVDFEVVDKIDDHNLIEAYGLVTRYWTHERGKYGCSECCNGDRCDEDCIAKYKGNRKNCPHCKGKGWIPETDAKQISVAIPKQQPEKEESERFVFSEDELYSIISRAQIAALKEDWQTPEMFCKKIITEYRNKTTLLN